MWVQKLRSMSIGRKVAVSIGALVFSFVVLNGIFGLVIYEDLTAFKSGDLSGEINKLAEDFVSDNGSDIDLLVGVKGLIEKSDSSVLNYLFGTQIGYNLLSSLGFGLFMCWAFLAKGLRSISFENKTPILFLASFVLAINVPGVAGSAELLNEYLGLDKLQELVFGTDKIDDAKSSIIQFLMLFPNEERGWLITLVGVALVPAIGEEVMFRGFLMKIFSRRYNHHNGIALSAFLFAIIHFNFTNFFYLFILGVILGYTYYWGKNLLFPILIHFLNNAQVLWAYFIVSGTPEDVLEKATKEPTSYGIISFITVGLSLLIFYMNFQRRKFLIK